MFCETLHRWQYVDGFRRVDSTSIAITPYWLEHLILTSWGNNDVLRNYYIVYCDLLTALNEVVVLLIFSNVGNRICNNISTLLSSLWFTLFR